jgi:hypothetical protein
MREESRTPFRTARVSDYALHPEALADIDAIWEYIDLWAWFEQAIAPRAGSPWRQRTALFEAVSEPASSPECLVCTF